MPDAENFRTNTLTVVGALGYVVFFALIFMKALGLPVTWQLLGVVVSISSGLMGLEFGMDFLPFTVTRNGGKSDE
jgi:hypothetical protein